MEIPKDQKKLSNSRFQPKAAQCQDDHVITFHSISQTDSLGVKYGLGTPYFQYQLPNFHQLIKLIYYRPLIFSIQYIYQYC